MYERVIISLKEVQFTSVGCEIECSLRHFHISPDCKCTAWTTLATYHLQYSMYR